MARIAAQVFSGSPLDRAGERRSDAEWLRARHRDDASRFLAVWRLQVLVAGGGAGLAWARPELLASAAEDPGPILLGVGEGERAHFAVDVSAQEDPVASLGLEGAAAFQELRAAALQLPAADAAIAAQARHLLDWHARHRFCPGCGAPTRAALAGYTRECGSTECRAQHFPRTDPVVIMLVVRGERCLLGRQPAWPHPFFSALAGFVEPGETLEEAVRREVAEEAGVSIGGVRYEASQPWPFPASLMLGCRAEALTEGIRIDREELDDARWFERAAVRAALAGPTPALALPPPLAIAHHLIRAWAEEDA